MRFLLLIIVLVFSSGCFLSPPKTENRLTTERILNDGKRDFIIVEFPSYIKKDGIKIFDAKSSDGDLRASAIAAIPDLTTATLKIK